MEFPTLEGVVEKEMEIHLYTIIQNKHMKI